MYLSKSPINYPPIQVVIDRHRVAINAINLLLVFFINLPLLLYLCMIIGKFRIACNKIVITPSLSQYFIQWWFLKLNFVCWLFSYTLYLCTQDIQIFNNIHSRPVWDCKQFTTIKHSGMDKLQ